ncbi:MAG: thioether cross-link-forming SCIFF peptide maturase [Firmicutes bacterium]|nr:thioether cross-link-forming SCIFF peptide maturase [Bacillota bacterium]
MIHVFRMNGYNIAVDGNSGSIHLLDNIGYQILNGMQQLDPLDDVIQRLKRDYPVLEIIEAYDEIKTLKEKEMLFTPNRIIEEAISLNKSDNSIKALCLHVAHDCNLSCAYCFASKGNYQSRRSLMSEEVAIKAVDFLIDNSGKRHNIEIDFFGGEPLLNFNTIKKVVLYGRKVEKNRGKKFYFTITTNGTLLNQENIDFINEYIDNVVISLDGRKEVHDSIRYDRVGKGTYDRIVPLAQKLVSGRNTKSYFIRGTFTARNKDFTRDVMHLADLGFKEISVEPVVGVGKDIHIKEEDIQTILDEYEKLAVEYLNCLQQGRNFRFYHFNLNLYEGPCIYKRIISCGAGFEYFAVSPEGHLYPCHQFVGQKDFVMGDIYHGIENTKLLDKFKNNNILTKERCRECWAKLFCSGGCHANAWYSNGDIAKPNDIACELQKKRIECAIMVQVATQKKCSVA